MNNESLKQFAELSLKLLGKERMIELIQWVSWHEGRAEKMTEYLRNNPEAKDSEINNDIRHMVTQRRSGIIIIYDQDKTYIYIAQSGVKETSRCNGQEDCREEGRRK